MALLHQGHGTFEHRLFGSPERASATGRLVGEAGDEIGDAHAFLAVDPQAADECRPRTDL